MPRTPKSVRNLVIGATLLFAFAFGAWRLGTAPLYKAVSADDCLAEYQKAKTAEERYKVDLLPSVDRATGRRVLCGTQSRIKLDSLPKATANLSR